MGEAVKINKQELVLSFIALLKTASKNLSLTDRDGKNASPELEAAYRSIFEAVEKLLAGDYDAMPVADFRRNILMRD